MANDEVVRCPVARRAVLLGTGAAGLTALLAACGADEENPGARSAPTSEAAAEPTGQAPVTELPAGPEPPENALVSIEEVPVAGGVLVDDVLVVQLSKGTFRAYDATCPHQQVVVDPPDESGVITCPGHLSRFKAGDGARISGPAPRGLKKVSVKVVSGYVVTT